METWPEAVLRYVMSAAKHDPEYQMLLRRCQELEPDYTAVMHELTQHQREVVDAYSFASVCVNFRMIALAFRCGQTCRFQKP